MNEEKVDKMISALGVTLMCIGFFSIVSLFYAVRFWHEPKQGVAEASSFEEPKINYSAWENTHIEAKSAYVLDMETGEVIFEKNADAQLPLASITKVMTAITASSLVPPETTVTIGKDDISEEGDHGLRMGERWKLGDLIRFSLLVSSNDAARAIAAVGASRPEFIKRMNMEAQKIGLSETYFLNESGLDLSQTLSGAYGSARDAAKMLSHALRTKPDIMEATSKAALEFKSEDKISHKGINTNRSIGRIPGVVASKTGFSALSGGNLVLAFEPKTGRKIVIAVLGSSFDGRFRDAEALALRTMQFLKDNQR